jgi:hypothetical protein
MNHDGHEEHEGGFQKGWFFELFESFVFFVVIIKPQVEK